MWTNTTVNSSPGVVLNSSVALKVCVTALVRRLVERAILNAACSIAFMRTLVSKTVEFSDRHIKLGHEIGSKRLFLARGKIEFLRSCAME